MTDTSEHTAKPVEIPELGTMTASSDDLRHVARGERTRHGYVFGPDGLPERLEATADALDILRIAAKPAMMRVCVLPWTAEAIEYKALMAAIAALLGDTSGYRL